MRLIAGGVELKEKWQRTITSFTQNFDQDDPEFISLREAFMTRFKEHGFVVDTIAKFNEETKALDDIIKRLQDLQKRNTALLKNIKAMRNLLVCTNVSARSIKKGKKKARNRCFHSLMMKSWLF